MSCSREDNPLNNTSTVEGTILRSYKQGSSTSQGEHFFENNGTRYEKIVRADGTTYIKYIYDSNNRMTKIIVAPDDTSYNDKTLFYYDNAGKITKMEKDRRFLGTTGELKTWLFTYSGNVVTQEFVSDEDPNYNHKRIRYTFNNEGFLVSYHDYNDSPNNTYVSTSLYMTFRYDNNKNMISLKRTDGGTHDLPDSPTNNVITNIISYEYDDKLNPLHLVYKNNYMNYIFSNNYPFNLERSSFQDRVVGTGRNNLKRTIYQIDPISGGLPIDNDYKNEYTYQTNNLPKRMGRVSITDNREYSYITFNYITE